MIVEVKRATVNTESGIISLRKKTMAKDEAWKRKKRQERKEENEEIEDLQENFADLDRTWRNEAPHVPLLAQKNGALQCGVVFIE